MSTFSHMRLEERLPDGGVASGGAIDPGPVLGSWFNTDKESRAIVRLDLDMKGDELMVRAFGADTPEPRDWGALPARVYASSVASTEGMAFTAVYRFDFVEVILAAYTKQGILVLDTFNTFTDGSPRANYFTREFFPPLTQKLRFGRATDLPRPGSSAPAWPDPGPLLGTWVNFDRDSQGLVKLEIARRREEMTLKAWGADAPEPREWPEIVGLPFAGDVESTLAVGFTALYRLGFLETRLAAYLNIRLLVVDTYNRFLDGSARSSYFKRDHYYLP